MTLKGIDLVDDFAYWWAVIFPACKLVAVLPVNLIASVDSLICQLQTNNKFFTLLLHLHFMLLYQ